MVLIVYGVYMRTGKSYYILPRGNAEVHLREANGAPRPAAGEAHQVGRQPARCVGVQGHVRCVSRDAVRALCGVRIHDDSSLLACWPAPARQQGCEARRANLFSNKGVCIEEAHYLPWPAPLYAEKVIQDPQGGRPQGKSRSNTAPLQPPLLRVRCLRGRAPRPRVRAHATLML
jgi:hypothetical protein